MNFLYGEIEKKMVAKILNILFEKRQHILKVKVFEIFQVFEIACLFSTSLFVVLIFFCPNAS
jgi:hypothetical protein